MMGNLVPLGQRLAAALLLLTISLFVLRVLLDGEGGFVPMIGRLVHLMLIFGVVMMILSGYAGAGQYREFGLPNLLQKTITSVNTALVGGDGSAIWDGVNQLLGAAFQVYKFISTTVSKYASVSKVFDLITLSPSLAIVAIAMLFLFGAAATLVGVAAVSTLLFGIGAALGPIFIPWLIFSPMAFLFHGWLKFMITATLMAIVGPVMVKLVSAGLTKIVALAAAAGQAGDASTSFVAASALLMLCALIAFLMAQVPSIAASLLHGGAGAGAPTVPLAQAVGGAAKNIGGSAAEAAYKKATAPKKPSSSNR
jgi:type IV secretory pathway VirB6-like protein